MFTRADLFALLEAAPSPGVSIYMPTHVLGRETRQDPIRLKNLAGQALAKSQSTGLTAAQAESLLAPALKLVDDYEFWRHQDQGLVLFLGAGEMRVHKAPLVFEELVVVGPAFHVRPLLPLLSADGAFLVLTITADKVRLFSASRFAMAEVDTSTLPGGLAEVKGDADYENPLQAAPIGRPRTGALDVSKAQVQGESPEDWHKSRLIEYVRRIALGLKDRLTADPSPVILAADAEIGGHFKKLAALEPLLEGTIEIDPASLDREQLHGAAYAVMQPRLNQARQKAIERFAALRGAADPRAARTIEAVARSAYEGRVETLLVAEGETVWRRFDPSTSELSPDQPAGTGQDLLDAVTGQTLRSGGAVYVLTRAEMPDGLSAAAILRY